METPSVPTPSAPGRRHLGWYMFGLFVLTGIGLPALAAVLARVLFE